MPEIRSFRPTDADEGELTECYELAQIWVARGDGKIVGLAVVALPERENRQLTITKVTVPPFLRRQGIGTALLAATLADARAEERITVTGQGLKAGGDGASRTPLSCGNSAGTASDVS
jgi:GNAT superfamily N-acetyltransferase